MGYRPSLNTGSSGTETVDELLGEAYKVVRTVEENLPAVQAVADNIDAVIAAGEIGDAIPAVETVAANIAAVNTNATNIAAIIAAGPAADTAEAAADLATSKADQATAQANAAIAAKVDAETAEDNAASHAAAALAAKIAAEAAFDFFDDRSLGAKATNPTLDNDGNALLDGAIYFNTTAKEWRAYDLATTSWYAAGSGGAANRLYAAVTGSGVNYTLPGEPPNDAGLDVIVGGVPQPKNGTAYTWDGLDLTLSEDPGDDLVEMLVMQAVALAVVPTASVTEPTLAGTLTTKLSIVVATRAELSALDTSRYGTAFLKEAGRSGKFTFVGSNLSAEVTADTLEGIYVAPDSDTDGSSGAWVRVVQVYLDPRWWGAAGNGATDDTAAIQACVNFAQTSEWPMFIPAKTFRITAAIAITSAIGIYGTDPYSSIIKPEGNIYAFDISYIVGPTIRDFSVAWASAPTAGAAFRVTAPAAQECGFLDAQNIRINNGWIGFYFVKASQWHLDRCVILDSGLTAIWVENQNNVDSGDSTIESCQLANPTKTGDTSGIIWRSSGGLRIINNKINVFKYGIQIQLADGAVTGDILITGNSLESVGYTGVDSAIRMARLGTTGTLHSVLITGNQINGWAAAVNVPLDATGAWLTGLSVLGSVIYGNTLAAASGVIVNSTTGFTISGNVMRSGAAGTVFITTGSSAADGYIDGNSPTGSFNADSIGSATTYFFRKFGTTAGLFGTAGFLVDGGAGTVASILRTASGQQAAFTFQTGTSNRWLFGKDNVAESGSNVGGNFFVNAYDDAGAFAFQPFSMSRKFGTFKVGTHLSLGNPVTKAADFTLGATENIVINTKSSSAVVTLPTASDYPGRLVYCNNEVAQTLSSASSNVVPKAGGSAAAAILPATAGAWALLASNGTNWKIVMSGT